MRGTEYFKSGRPLVVAILAVVVSFCASLLLSHVPLYVVDDATGWISEDAVPSVEHLGAARSALRHMETLTGEYLLSARQGEPADAAGVEAARREMRDQLHKYRNLPVVAAREQMLYDDLSADLGLINQTLTLTLSEIDAHQFRAAETHLQGMHRSIDLVDEKLRLLTDLNGDQARQATARIRKAQHDAKAVTFHLGGASLLISLAATALAIRSYRQQDRLEREHLELLEARASELEAFAGRVAHDLKSPLGSLALRVSINRMRADDPQKAAELDQMTRLVGRMDRVINGMLAFAVAGARPTPGCAADLASVIDEVVTDQRPAADAAATGLTVEPFDPVYVACTPEALTSILSNLVGNAIKYIVDGKQPDRRVSVKVLAGETTVRLEVIDNGPGLPPGADQIVFQPFRRLGSGHQAGIGLGLATVRRLVLAYHGSVGVQSVPGRGSSFWVELPIAGAPTPPSLREHGEGALPTMH